MWKQTGFAVISEARHGDDWLPVVHAFCLSEREAEEQCAVVEKLPEPLREGLRIVPAILRFDA